MNLLIREKLWFNQMAERDKKRYEDEISRYNENSTTPRRGRKPKKVNYHYEAIQVILSNSLKMLVTIFKFSLLFLIKVLSSSANASNTSP